MEFGKLISPASKMHWIVFGRKIKALFLYDSSPRLKYIANFSVVFLHPKICLHCGNLHCLHSSIWWQKLHYFQSENMVTRIKTVVRVIKKSRSSHWNSTESCVYPGNIYLFCLRRQHHLIDKASIWYSNLYFHVLISATAKWFPTPQSPHLLLTRLLFMLFLEKYGIIEYYCTKSAEGKRQQVCISPPPVGNKDPSCIWVGRSCSPGPLKRRHSNSVSDFWITSPFLQDVSWRWDSYSCYSQTWGRTGGWSCASFSVAQKLVS